MDFQELIRVRRSLRGYKSDPIAEDVLYRVLGAGRIAPTAANLQPFHLIVVTDPETRARMKEVYVREWFYTAPVILVGCVEPAKAWQRADGFNAAEIDMGIVMDHIILAATEEGLATCWVCNFDEGENQGDPGHPARGSGDRHDAAGFSQCGAAALRAQAVGRSRAQRALVAEAAEATAKSA
jgi:nitroreductase